MADSLADRLRIAAATFREDGHVSLPELLEEAAAQLNGTPPAGMRAQLGSLKVSIWPTGPEYAFNPVDEALALPPGEYPLYAEESA